MKLILTAFICLPMVVLADKLWVVEPILKWAISDEQELSGISQVDSDKFVEHVVDRRADWIHCMETEDCEYIRNYVEEHKSEVGVKGFRFDKSGKILKDTILDLKNWLGGHTRTENRYGAYAILEWVLDFYTNPVEYYARGFGGIIPDKLLLFVFRNKLTLWDFCRQRLLDELIDLFFENQHIFIEEGTPDQVNTRERWEKRMTYLRDHRRLFGKLEKGIITSKVLDPYSS